MRSLLTVIISCLLAGQTFALDRTVIKDSHGRTIGKIVSNNGRSVITDRSGRVVGVGLSRGNRAVIVMKEKPKPRATGHSSVYPAMPSWKK